LKGCRRVGVNFRGISHHDFLSLKRTLRTKKLLDVAEALSKSRLIKDRDELQAITKAARIISSVVDEVPEMLRKGMIEKELKSEIDHLTVTKGADSPSFDSIVAFGENSAIPHYSAGERPLRREDNVLIDVGARCDLYCSDITRTFFFGRPAETQRAAYAKVLEAQTRAMRSISEGVTGREVHKVAAGVIDKSRFKGKFTHGLGHSLGLEVHDGPGLSLRNPHRLRRNMVLTVEPGIYLPGRGGVRIEDDVVVTEDSCRQLTTSPKQLFEV
jgi:Xaa-Pro dipeptidase